MSGQGEDGQRPPGIGPAASERPAKEGAADAIGRATRLLTDRRNLFRIFFFAAFVLLLVQLLRVLSPFFSPLVAAATLVVIVHPVHRRLLARLQRWPSVAAGIGTALVIVLVILPVTALLWMLSREMTAFLPVVRDWMQESGGIDGSSVEAYLPERLVPAWQRAEAFLAGWGIDLRDVLASNAEQLGEVFQRLGTRLLRNIPLFVIDLFVLLFAVFFFMRDGKRMLAWILAIVPMERSHAQLIVARLDETVSAVVRGALITAVVQGLLAGIGFQVVGLRFAVLLGVATVFLAMIPFVGPASLWIPVAIYLLFRGPLWAGIFMVLWGLLVVSLVDNVLKPILIGERARISTFLLLLGILGGIQAYGFLGVLVGPMLITMLLSFAAIYREEFHPLDPAPPPSPS